MLNLEGKREFSLLLSNYAECIRALCLDNQILLVCERNFHIFWSSFDSQDSFASYDNSRLSLDNGNVCFFSWNTADDIRLNPFVNIQDEWIFAPDGLWIALLAVNFILSCYISCHEESVATLLNNFQAAIKPKLKVVIFIKKRRDYFAVVEIIDRHIDTFSFWNIVSISSDSYFIYLNNHKLIDPFNASIDSFVL